MQLCRIIYYSLAAQNYPTQLHLVGHFCILYHDARKHEYQLQDLLQCHI